MKAMLDRITNFNLDQLPLLTASEQTKGSWAKEIETPEMIPDLYKDFYKTRFNGNNNFPYSVIPPKFNGFLRQENEKLICSLDNKIIILENTNSQLIEYCYSIQDINYVEAGSILLKAWIRINGLTDVGQGGMFFTVMLIVLAGMLFMMMRAYSPERAFGITTIIIGIIAWLFRILDWINDAVITILTVLMIFGIYLLVKEAAPFEQ